jgi:hypothetical protein
MQSKSPKEKSLVPFGLLAGAAPSQIALNSDFFLCVTSVCTEPRRPAYKIRVILAQPSQGNLPEGINFVRFSPRAEAEVKEALTRRFQMMGRESFTAQRGVGGRQH